MPEMGLVVTHAVSSNGGYQHLCVRNGVNRGVVRVLRDFKLMATEQLVRVSSGIITQGETDNLLLGSERILAVFYKRLL